MCGIVFILLFFLDESKLHGSKNTMDSPKDDLENSSDDLNNNSCDDDNELTSSQESSSQKSIIISDDELNYSSIHSKDRNKYFYSLSDAEEISENNEDRKNSMDIDEIYNLHSGNFEKIMTIIIFLINFL